MKTIYSSQSEAAMRRLVLVRAAVGVAVVLAVVLAPPVIESIATLESSRLLAQLLAEDGERIQEPGIDVLQTTAEPVEPMSMSY